MASPELDLPDEPSIGDHGVIGDMGTAALVDRWGRVNWLCWPRFDSPPLFRRLIDPPRGGYWQLAPSSAFSAARRYVPDTNTLETIFTCAAGTAVAHDFMAVPADDRGPMLVRMVEGRSGDIPFRMAVHGSVGFSRDHVTMRTVEGAIALGDEAAVVSTAPGQVSLDGGTAVANTVVAPDRPFIAVLAAPELAQRVRGSITHHATALRDGTGRWWRTWLAGSRLPERHRQAVARSALTVKLLHHQGANALVAAPTTSLPERIGGPRNWDYRYTWLRDTSMMVLALQQLDHHDEAMAYWDWIGRVAERDGGDLAVAHTIDGEMVAAEEEIHHLAGHRGSRPVRTGNNAARQRQHDVYGNVMAAAAHCYHHMPEMARAEPQHALRRIADLAAERWHLPDDSIWEARNDRRHHTYSKLMCWLALDRAVDLHHHDALAGDVATWSSQRQAVRGQILRRAWNERAGAFTAALDGDDLDAAALVVPLVGFLPAHDLRCRATRDAIATHLGDGGLVRRYQRDDGLGEPDNPFLLCTLWLADNHTADGDPDRGEQLVEAVLGTGNDLGLLGEEADPTSHEPLGNFPLGLSHLGVIHSIHRLERISGAGRS